MPKVKLAQNSRSTTPQQKLTHYQSQASQVAQTLRQLAGYLTEAAQALESGSMEQPGFPISISWLSTQLREPRRIWREYSNLKRKVEETQERHATSRRN